MTREDEILIHKFLRKELTLTEEALLKDLLKSDGRFRERFYLETSLYESLDDNSWSFISKLNGKEVKEYSSLYSSKDAEFIKANILEAQKAYHKISRPTKIRVFYGVVAAVIITISTIFLWPSTLTNQELYSEYLSRTEVFSLIDRGNSDRILSNSQINFENKDYRQVIKDLSGEINQTDNSTLFIYLAIAQMELSYYEDAEKTLNKLISSDLLDAEKGHWFKSLLFLKSNKVEKAKNELNLIINKGLFNQKLASELLKNLN